MKKFPLSPTDLVLMIMIATLVLVGQPPGFADQVTIKADRDAHNNPWALGNPNDPATNIWTLVDWTYVEPGGWYDFRIGFWHYNCSSLPANVTSFVASLYCLPRGDSSTNMEMDFWIPNVPWSETTCFPKTGPTGYNLGRIAATPTPNKWFSIELASVYNHPTYGPLLRANGFMLVPRSTNNNFNVFASSEYATTSYRPKAVVNYINLKFPLSGTFSTSKITGYDFGSWWQGKTCADGSHTLLHTGIDLTAAAGTLVSSSKAGTVKYAGTDPTWGGYICTQHTENGITYTITYTHVVPGSDIVTGTTVTEGQMIGSVANIPGPHLHLQVRKAPYHSTWSLRGRLPQVQCYVNVNGSSILEPAFPEYFIDPKKIKWH